MKITVVTATIHPDDALALTLASVADQRDVDVESIVVDGRGRSEDFKSRFPKSRFICQEPRGVYNAINHGISHAEGDIIGLLHGSDTFTSPTVLKQIADEFEADPGLDFVYGNIQYVSGLSRTPRRVYYGGDFRPGDLQYGIHPPHPSLYIRREAAQRIGKYREDLVIAGDVDMWIRLFNSGLHYKYMPLTMVYMTTGGLSTTLKARLYTNNIEKLKVLRDNGLKANPLKLTVRYFDALRQLIWKRNRH